MNRTLLSFLFLINLIGNGSWLTQEFTLLSVVMVILFSSLSSTIEAFVYSIIPSSVFKHIYAAVIIVLHNMAGITDYFLVYHYNSVIDLQVIDAILLTNENEASEFVSAFITQAAVAMTSVCCFAVNITAYLVAKYLNKFKLTEKIIRWCAALSVIFIVANLVLFFSYRISINALMHHTFTRVAWGYRHFKYDIQMDSLVRACREVRATAPKDKPLTMVVVIGESHSVYHTSLYGYDKQTYPLMCERERNGELFVMQQAATAFDVTSPTMWSVFSLDSMGNASNQTPLFPAVFKAAGYRTYDYDNEFLKNRMVHVMTNSTLSDVMYDQRNDHYYPFDGDMVDDLPVADDSLALYVIHLSGHHVSYSQRYPSHFAQFGAKDYQGPQTEEQKEVIATYDNACLYNDFVIDRIIRKFEDRNTVVAYFADHGEEIYDIRDFRGHMTSRTSPDPSYQLRVPLWIWLSKRFKEHNPDKAELLKRSRHLHIKTDDISHFLIDMAGIETPYFNRSRSFLSVDAYRGWNDYQEFINSNGVYTDEGKNMRQF